MRRSIREVNMNMIDAAALEMVGKVKGIARALLCLGAGAIFSLVPVNQDRVAICRSFSHSFLKSLRFLAAARNEWARANWRYARAADL